MDRGSVYDTWLELACLVFGLFSLLWAVTGSFDPLDIWNGFAADALFDGETPADVARFRRFILGPFGATSAAYFLLLYYVVRHPFRAREPWAFTAVAGSIALWFVVDSAVSVLRGATFNVVLVNVPCLLVLGFPLLRLHAEFRQSAARAVPASGGSR